MTVILKDKKFIMERRRFKNKIVCFFAFCAFTSCQQHKEKGNIPETTVIELSAPLDFTGMAEEYVDSLLVSLTLEEMAGQCLMPSIFASDDNSTRHLLKKYIEDCHIGGIVLLQGNIEGAKVLADIAKKSSIPMFIAIDAEWGLGMRLSDAPVYPKNGNISGDTEETALYDYGRKIAEESRTIGINMILGPVLDVNDNPGGVIGKRSFGGNPIKVSNYGVAYSKGLESGGVISVAKHFPGHGFSSIDSHKGVARLYRNISGMDTVELRPFRDYINSGLSGIMAGHIMARALDPEGNAASVSPAILSYLLRDEMGFKGLILTDAFDMGGAEGNRAVDALKAGADIVLCPLDVEKEYKNILHQVAADSLSVSTLKERCRRILFYKYLVTHPHSLEESL